MRALRILSSGLEKLGKGLQAHQGFYEILSKHQTLQPLSNAFPRVTTSSFVAPSAALIGNVNLAPGSSVWYGSVVRAEERQISIGENSNVQEAAVITCGKNMDTSIGANVSIGAGAILSSCSIGDNVLIGDGASVLRGAVISSNVIIGAGSVVPPNTTIPASQVWVGNPARFLRNANESDIALIQNTADQVSISKSTHSEELYKDIETLVADEEAGDDLCKSPQPTTMPHW